MSARYLTRIAGIATAGLTALSLSAAAYADSSNRVNFKNRVNIKVGQAMVFHGLRGDCGSLPTKAATQRALDTYNAELQTGRIQFGKPGVRKSGQCNGDTPVLETLFVATTPGRERVDIFGDTVLFIVK